MAFDSLHVSGLPPSATRESLNALFAPVGGVCTRLFVPGQRYTFIDVPKGTVAEAVKLMNGCLLHNVRLDVRHSHRTLRRFAAAAEAVEAALVTGPPPPPPLRRRPPRHERSPSPKPKTADRERSRSPTRVCGTIAEAPQKQPPAFAPGIHMRPDQPMKWHPQYGVMIPYTMNGKFMYRIDVTYGGVPNALFLCVFHPETPGKSLRVQMHDSQFVDLDTLPTAIYAPPA
jgi:hypothetical protein